ncbi:MAG: hypothetical protein J6T70_18670, partial [Bacteroidales bacterium]|nr:hypothetical protein [Bacteroidales bacterium]
QNFPIFIENNAFYTYLQKMIYKNTIMDETVLNMLSINDFAKKFKTLIDRKLEGTFNICSCNKVSFRSFITRFSNYQLLSKISNDYKEFTGKSNLIGCVEQDDFIAEMNKLFRTNPTLFGC